MSVTVAAGTLFTALLILQSAGLADGTKAPAAAPSAAVAGRRFFQAGQFAKAAAKLEAATIARPADQELLFELAICYERLDRDSEAIATFRRYQTSPIALRVREADQHIQAIESKPPRSVGAGDVAKPRHVLVPIAGDGGKCVKACAPMPGRCANSARCWAVQFICVRGCPGARVEPGSCLSVPSTSRQECVNDGWP
jgi:hypothetical protein